MLGELGKIRERDRGRCLARWAALASTTEEVERLALREQIEAGAAFLREFYPAEVRVEPLANFPILRDLIIDMSDFLEKLRRVKPWIIREAEKPVAEGEYRQTPAELDLYHQFTACINCMLCYAACPVYGIDPSFIGPAAIALAHRYNLDSRDRGRAERCEEITSHEGIWQCTFVGECSVVCPKDVDPAAAIQRTKVGATADWFKSFLLPWGRR